MASPRRDVITEAFRWFVDCRFVMYDFSRRQSIGQTTLARKWWKPKIASAIALWLMAPTGITTSLHLPAKNPFAWLRVWLLRRACYDSPARAFTWKRITNREPSLWHFWKKLRTTLSCLCVTFAFFFHWWRFHSHLFFFPGQVNIIQLLIRHSVISTIQLLRYRSLYMNTNGET